MKTPSSEIVIYIMEPYVIDPNTQWSNSNKILDQFVAYRVAYKFVKSQPIHAFFIIPKQLPPGPRPLLVRFHGGGWTEGEADASIRPLYVLRRLVVLKYDISSLICSA